MSLIVIFILILAILIGIRIILNIDMLTIKELAKNDKLNKITDAFPENIEICKKICSIIGNTKL